MTKTGKSHIFINHWQGVRMNNSEEGEGEKQNREKQRHRSQNFWSILGLVKLSGLSLSEEK